MLKIKIFAFAAFLAIASSVFLVSSNKTEAQVSENTKKSDELLEKVANYKNWKQVQKPEKKSENPVTTDVLSISNSSIAG